VAAKAATKTEHTNCANILVTSPQPFLQRAKTSLEGNDDLCRVY